MKPETNRDSLSLQNISQNLRELETALQPNLGLLLPFSYMLVRGNHLAGQSLNLGNNLLVHAVHGPEGAPLLTRLTNKTPLAKWHASKSSDGAIEAWWILEPQAASPSNESVAPTISGIGLDIAGHTRALEILCDSSIDEWGLMFFPNEVEEALYSSAGTQNKKQEAALNLLATFSAKEAAFKALGDSFAHSSLRDSIIARGGFMQIEIRSASSSHPQIILHEGLTEVAKMLRISRLECRVGLFSDYVAALCCAVEEPSCAQ